MPESKKKDKKKDKKNKTEKGTDEVILNQTELKFSQHFYSGADWAHKWWQKVYWSLSTNTTKKMGIVIKQYSEYYKAIIQIVQI